MARVKVTEPRTGSVVEVDADSPLAKQWQQVGGTDKAPAKKAASRKKSEK